MTIDAGNKIISEFMGGKDVMGNYGERKITFPLGRSPVPPKLWFCYNEVLYHSSWNWQIPAWSKLYNDIISWLYSSPAKIEKFLEEKKQLEIFEHNYASAISVNSTADGLTIILVTLEWYNKQKETYRSKQEI